MATSTLHTDQQLFRQIAEGDEAAFAVLFHRHRGPLFDYACKITKSIAAAEELVQDCFLKIWIHRDRLTEIGNPIGYIHNIARNAALDHFRRLTLDRGMQRRTLAALATGANTTLEELDRSETRRLLQAAMEQLSDQQQRIFNLSREQGLSYIEIGEKLGISPNTVRNHMVKALQTIREYLSTHYGGPVALIILTFLEKNFFLS